MTTRNKITEQAMRLYMRAFDREDIKPKVERREVALLVDQVANEMLSVEQQQATRLGVVDIPTCMIATYTAQAVAVSGGVYSTNLPAYPIQLPMDIGVWSVYGEPSGPAFIPIKTDFWDLLGAEDEGLLEDQIGFYVEGRKIIYTQNPVATTVKVKLLIVDPSLLGEFDPYPIPADMEFRVAMRVVEILSARGLAPEKPKG
jgi:hypothetical protein